MSRPASSSAALCCTLFQASPDKTFRERRLAWANVFTMQTSEPQITYYLVIGFLQVLLAPKGQLLTAQLSPLTLIKVFLGSWLWRRTFKVGFFFLNLLFSPGGVFLKTPNLWTFQYILQDTSVYTFDWRWRHSTNPQVEIILLSSLCTVYRRIWDYLLRNLLPKNLWQQYKLTSVPFCKRGSWLQ